jgi:hypothetical protein
VGKRACASGRVCGSEWVLVSAAVAAAAAVEGREPASCDQGRAGGPDPHLHPDSVEHGQAAQLEATLHGLCGSEVLSEELWGARLFSLHACRAGEHRERIEGRRKIMPLLFCAPRCTCCRCAGRPVRMLCSQVANNDGQIE